jgi:hypothetical protein
MIEKLKTSQDAEKSFNAIIEAFSTVNEEQ